MRRIRAVAPATVGLMAILACGGGEEAADGGKAGRRARSEVPRPGPVGDAEKGPTVEGRITFAVDGQPFTFDHLPSDLNYHTPLASSAGAKPDAESPEVLRILFLSVDLKALEYPTELPPPRERRTPAMVAATVGFSYIDATGREWAGPGTVLIQSFDGAGRLVVTFDDVRLPHTDNELPDINLTGGEVRAVLE